MSFFSPRYTDTPNPFRPPLQYLIASGRPHPSRPILTRRDSNDSIDSDMENRDSKVSSYSQTELRPSSIPLITLSRSPSPYARRDSNSVRESFTDDEQDFDVRPSLLARGGQRKASFKAFLLQGGLGQLLFTTAVGWQFYVTLLAIWCMGCAIGVTLLNIITLSTGVYKFPYPVTISFIELFSTYLLLWALASLTRILSPYIAGAGLAGMVSPTAGSSQSILRGTRRQGFLGIFTGTGGIAGGGLLEFDLTVARQLLPVTIVFVLKVLFSTLCLGYTQYSRYVQCRIAIVPLSILFSTYVNRSAQSIPVLSATLTATFTLLIATHKSNIRVTWDAVAVGIASSVCVALYPVMLQKAYKAQVAALSPQADLLSDRQGESATDASGTKEEARASWRVMHYISLMSILIYVPILLISGEIGNIWRNCYFLDAFFHWFMMVCQGLGAWAVFLGTFAMTRATSPLTTTFLFIPRVAFLYPLMCKMHLSAHSWIGVAMCWASVLWFVKAQRRQGRVLNKLTRSRT